VVADGVGSRTRPAMAALPQIKFWECTSTEPISECRFATSWGGTRPASRSSSLSPGVARGLEPQDTRSDVPVCRVRGQHRVVDDPGDLGRPLDAASQRSSSVSARRTRAAPAQRAQPMPPDTSVFVAPGMRAVARAVLGRSAFASTAWRTCPRRARPLLVCRHQSPLYDGAGWFWRSGARCA